MRRSCRAPTFIMHCTLPDEATVRILRHSPELAVQWPSIGTLLENAERLEQVASLRKAAQVAESVGRTSRRERDNDPYGFDRIASCEDGHGERHGGAHGDTSDAGARGHHPFLFPAKPLIYVKFP
jgi:hypothetical protein